MKDLNYKNIIILLSLIIAEVAAESLLQHASTKTLISAWENSLILGIIAYMMVAFLFYYFLKNYNGSFGLANIIWQVSNIIIITLISHFILDSQLNQIQWVGLVFLIIGFALSAMKGPISNYL